MWHLADIQHVSQSITKHEQQIITPKTFFFPIKITFFTLSQATKLDWMVAIRMSQLSTNMHLVLMD